jgi:hypothetical protein
MLNEPPLADPLINQRPLQRLRLISWRAHQTSRSSSVVKITGMAFGWIGPTAAMRALILEPSISASPKIQ